MKRPRLACSFFAAGPLAGLLAALLVAPVAAGAQTMAERSRAAKKIKVESTRKVWTNEDLQRLEGGWGVNVVGTSIEKREETAAPAGQAAAPQQPAASANFYSDMSMEEREQWIAKYEREIVDAEAILVELRSRALTAPSEEERATASEQVAAVERAVEANRVEIELIRNTPAPKPVKPKPAAPAPSAPTSPSA